MVVAEIRRVQAPSLPKLLSLVCPGQLLRQPPCAPAVLTPLGTPFRALSNGWPAGTTFKFVGTAPRTFVIAGELLFCGSNLLKVWGLLQAATTLGAMTSQLAVGVLLGLALCLASPAAAQLNPNIQELIQNKALAPFITKVRTWDGGRPPARPPPARPPRFAAAAIDSTAAGAALR